MRLLLSFFFRNNAVILINLARRSKVFANDLGEENPDLIFSSVKLSRAAVHSALI